MSISDDTDTGSAPESTKPASKVLKPQYPNVEAWVRDYLLPSFPRPAGELGATGRWRWCEQWWRHDEAVTILTALWYGWEHSAVQTLGMLDWLPRLYHLYPILGSDDGPFRLCTPSVGDLPARHEMSAVADVTPAPPGWWRWWGTEATPNIGQPSTDVDLDGDSVLYAPTLAASDGGMDIRSDG